MPKFPIVGMSHRFPAQAVMNYLPADTPLYLVREPGNQYDVNAIQVWVKNAAEAFGDNEVIEALHVMCTEQGKETPDFTVPFMLGYIKAQTIDDDNLGADVLAPRLDKMVEDGTIGDAEQVPCILVYGSSGRPALTIVESSDDDELGEIEEPDGGDEELVDDEDDADSLGEADGIGDAEDFTKADHE